MKKSLLLLRHAKSSWSEPGTPDFDRPLNDRGKRDAPRAGEVLRDRRLPPDLILSSSAKRARKTATKALEASGFDSELELVQEFYLATPDAYLAKLKTLPDEIHRVLVVGHNPGLEELLELLTGQQLHLPTAALAHLKLPIDSWSAMQPDLPCELDWFWTPKEGG
jgi:phosphohistidine phosphatase